MSSDQGFTDGKVESLSLLKAAIVAAMVAVAVYFVLFPKQQKEAAAPPRQPQRQQQRNVSPDQCPSIKQSEKLRSNQVDKDGAENKMLVESKPIAGLYDLTHCRNCAKFLPKEERKLCAKCKLVAYCSKDCQVKDWKMHKKNSCVRMPDGSKLKITHKKQTSNPNAIRPDVVMLGIRAKAMISPMGLSRPFLPGWPLREHWPVSQDELLGLSKYFYRYPGFEYEETPQALANWSKIESWNKYTSHLDEKEMMMNPKKYIEEIMPFVKEDFPVPMALDAMQFLYLVAAMGWRRNSSRPSEEHSRYFSTAVEYMNKFSQTGEIGCEYMLGNLLLRGDEDHSYPPNVKKGLGLLEKCAQRGGDGGRAAWSIAIHYGEKSAETGSVSSEDYLNRLKFFRLAAEQGHTGACEKMIREGMMLVQNGIVEPNWIEQWTSFQVPQVKKSLTMMNSSELIKYKKRIARGKEQVEWDLYGFDEPLQFC